MVEQFLLHCEALTGCSLIPFEAVYIRDIKNAQILFTHASRACHAGLTAYLCVREMRRDGHALSKRCVEIVRFRPDARCSEPCLCMRIIVKERNSHPRFILCVYVKRLIDLIRYLPSAGNYRINAQYDSLCPYPGVMKKSSCST